MEPDWEIVEAEDEQENRAGGSGAVAQGAEKGVKAAAGAGGQQGEAAQLAFWAGFGQGALVSVRRGSFVGTVPLYFSS